MTPGPLGFLTRVEVDSGVSSDTGKPFCTVRAIAESGTVLVGQLDVGTVRQMALDWLGAAEAAESDAAVLAELTQGLGLPIEHAGRFVSALRARRES